jgi:hypothetical protein
MDEDYLNKVSIYLICDGIDKLSDEFLKSAARAKIYDEFQLRNKSFATKGE